MGDTVCIECCQIKLDGLCKCNGGSITEKKFGLVDGCLMYLPNGIRCKEDTTELLFVCSKCNLNVQNLFK